MTLTLSPFRVPLRAPLSLAGRTYHVREGVLVRIEMGGQVAWGEASPLPGFSRDTLAEARDALAALPAGTLQHALDTFSPDLGFDLPILPPSACAAVEMALLDLAARTRGRSMAQMLHPEAARTASVNGLITSADAAEAAGQAEALARAGYKAVKLKVGRRQVGTDLARVHAVAAALPADVALRLDANRAWSLAEVTVFAGGLGDVTLAYVEEPVARPEHLADAARLLPVALDESLVGASPVLLDAYPFARAVVLKPMLLGGVVTAWRWAVAARARGMDAVVSAAFETGVGLRANVALAAALGGWPPAGLDTYRYLARDVLAAPLPIDGPALDVAAVLAPLALLSDA